LRLPYKYRNLCVRIDADVIGRELADLGPDVWVRHGFHETGHDVVPLISSRGTLTNADGTTNHALLPPFLPTPHLDRMPYTREVIHSFGAPVHRTRFALMRPGQTIAPHRDLQPNWYNKVRVHIPIRTNDRVKVHIWEESDILLPEDRTDVHFSPGSAWVFDTWRVHGVTNFSDKDRIHLIIDMEPLGKLFKLMFDGIDLADLHDALGYEYPRQYVTDRKTLEWLTAGDLEAGRKLWNAEIVDRNPQVGRYVHERNFWES
jgi:hypothetical protein